MREDMIEVYKMLYGIHDNIV